MPAVAVAAVALRHPAARRAIDREQEQQRQPKRKHPGFVADPPRTCAVPALHHQPLISLSRWGICGAHNTLLDLEDMAEQQRDQLHERYEALARFAREQLQDGSSDTDTPEP